MKKSHLITVLVALVLITGLLLYFRSLSNEVKEAFITLEERIDKSNLLSQQKSDSIFLLITEGNKQTSDRGRLLDSISNQLDDYLTSLKKDKEQSITNDGYEAWESSSYLDSRFFNGATIALGGHEFLEQIDVYRTAVSENFKADFSEIIEDVESNFSTAPILDTRGKLQNWLPYHFKGFPLVASVTKITQMQADIKITRIELFTALVTSEE
ncbi:MAG: hypothetical protein JKY22_02130 [Flavobacteriaceae bacterium]|nr:hypothetical protein [Flavobacteriaceae bacterium]